MAADSGYEVFQIPSTTGGTAENTISLAAAATVGLIVAPYNLDIFEIGFEGVGTAWTVTAPALTFTKRPQPGSATGEVTIGVVTSPALASLPTTLGGAGIGITVRKYVPNKYSGGTGTGTTAVVTVIKGSPADAPGPGRIMKGEVIRVSVTTTSTAGTAVAYVKCYPCGEDTVSTCYNNATPNVIITTDVASTT